ncbi:MAG: shikimate dehydrogenase [Rhodospirillales bacterium]|nr:shikimate dehydrogenase [Rhodospirillales bacterium]
MTTGGKTIRAGVIGWPTEHSLSPRLHGYWLNEYGIDGTYVAIPAPPEDFPAALVSLVEQGFAGVNVTVPHKQAAALAVDDLDDNAKRLGAVNTIVVKADGSLSGSNTDGFGFMENLKSGASGWSVKDGPAVVIGAGGAARAIVAALLDEGAPTLRLVNRTQERAQALAADIGGAIDVVSWQDRAATLDGAALLVNTTTLGMTGNAPLDLDLGPLPKGALVTDIVYAPLETPLLVAAQLNGNRTVDGLGMLLHQARPGFRQWFGAEPTVTDGLRAAVLKGLE